MNEKDMRRNQQEQEAKYHDLEAKHREILLAFNAKNEECAALVEKNGELETQVFAYEKKIEYLMGQIAAYKFCISGGSCNDDMCQAPII